MRITIYSVLSVLALGISTSAGVAQNIVSIQFERNCAQYPGNPPVIGRVRGAHAQRL